MVDVFKDYFSLIAIVIALGTTVYSWLTSRSRHNEIALTKLEEKYSNALAKMDERQDKAESRLAKVEGELQHLPTKEGQHQLEIAMERLAGDMKTMTEAMKGTRSTVNRMEVVLLERNTK